MSNAAKPMACADYGRRYTDPETVRSGQCPRCQGPLAAISGKRWRQTGLPPLKRGNGRVKGRKDDA